MIKLTPPVRKQDAYGSGYFGASRGGRMHRGIDYVAQAGSLVHSNIDGKVTKLGYPYADDLSFRYVQITTTDGLDYRFFYVDPSVSVGAMVTVGDIIGSVQDLNTRYKGITPHIHFEVKRGSEHLNPIDYF